MAGDYHGANTSQRADEKENVAGKVVGTVSDLITIVKSGENRTVTETYYKGYRYSRYNHSSGCSETVIINATCEVDVLQQWNTSKECWEHRKVLWETARPLPPKPPGFWAKLWARVTGRGAKLPQVKLLKG